MIELGYNDRPLRASIDRVLRELRGQGVKRVAWINLSERRTRYRDTNLALDAAAARGGRSCGSSTGAQASFGRGSWFIDGIHLTAAGKSAFARFLAHALSRLR